MLNVENRVKIVVEHNEEGKVLELEYIPDHLWTDHFNAVKNIKKELLSRYTKDIGYTIQIFNINVCEIPQPIEDLLREGVKI